METLISLSIYIIQIIIPFLAIIIIYLCFQSMRNHVRNKRPLIMLVNKLTKEKIPVSYWENSIGRSKSSDIILDHITVSRDHAVLFRREDGWIISDTNSKSGVEVNGNIIEGREKVFIDDVINIGGIPLILKKAVGEFQDNKSYFFDGKKALNSVSSGVLLAIVTIFHILATIVLSFSEGSFNYKPFIVSGAFTGTVWIYFLINKYIFRRVSFELEALGIFLSGIGIITICGINQKEAYTQLIAFGIGLFLFNLVILFIKNPERAVKWRLGVAALAVGLMAVNLIFGAVRNGSQNWIIIGGFSIQPSELVKVAFILVGTSTLERLQTAKNLTEFIVFSGVCMGSLFLMGDFGTACIFFVTFIIIAFMRSGSFRTIALILSAAAIGAGMILKFKPYIMDRFSVWRHAWEHVNDTGYQQTRVLTYSASGGLFGVGLGKGCLKNIFAAANDLIFGVLCEEWGLILALSVVMCIGFIALYGRNASLRSRSVFYSIASCSAAGMIVFQMCLNVFGATDILPLTGVTLPFISSGGSSMVSVWGLLAFIKAADERTYAARR